MKSILVLLLALCVTVPALAQRLPNAAAKYQSVSEIVNFSQSIGATATDTVTIGSRILLPESRADTTGQSRFLGFIVELESDDSVALNVDYRYLSPQGYPIGAGTWTNIVSTTTIQSSNSAILTAPIDKLYVQVRVRRVNAAAARTVRTRIYLASY